VVDVVIGILLCKLYNNQQSGWEYNTKYSVEQANQDVIILGDSRGTHNYIPTIITNKLQLSAYNASRDDQSILYHYAIFKSIIKRHQPKIIIVDITYNMLDYDPRSYTQLKYLLPLYKSHPEIQPIVEKGSPFEKLKLLSASYPFNSLFFTMLKSLKQDTENIVKKGSVPINGSYVTTPFTKKSIAGINIDENKQAYLLEMIQTCNKLGIQLYLTVAPFYYKTGFIDPSFTIIEALAKKNGAYFINCSNMPIFLQQPTLFYNNENLNNTGATLYTNLLMDTILSIKKR
jgi:hypothetical protein